jgi:uncharacterized protein
LAFAALMALPDAVLAAPIPELSAPVTDLTGRVPAADVEAVAARIAAHHAAAHVAIRVLVVATTAGEPIEDYASRVAASWSVTRKYDDHGVLVLLALDDQRSRLQHSGGLRSYLPDDRAQQILDGVRPSLQAKEFGRAISKIADDVIAATASLAPPTQVAEGDEPASSPWELPPVVLGVLTFYFALLGVVAFTLSAGATPVVHRRWSYASFAAAALLVALPRFVEQPSLSVSLAIVAVSGLWNGVLLGASVQATRPASLHRAVWWTTLIGEAIFIALVLAISSPIRGNRVKYVAQLGGLGMIVLPLFGSVLAAGVRFFKGGSAWPWTTESMQRHKQPWTYPDSSSSRDSSSSSGSSSGSSSSSGGASSDW